MNELSSFLLSVVESSSDAIIGLNPDGHIISWNPGAERIYARSAAEMMGASIDQLSLPDRASETSMILARILNGERVQHFQTVHLKKGGIPIPVSLSISPVVDSNNHIVGASFIARDLSHHFTFEKTLHETEQRYQKLKSSLELAHHIQATLLPSVDNIHCGFDLHAKTLYSEDVGGDYYDFFCSQDSCGDILGLAVGDVSGHGTGSALLMAMAKGVLQAEVKHFPLDLVAVMNRMNRFFCRDTDDEMFMTLFLAVIDIHERLLRWCSAGQGPVYIYHPQEQRFEELASTGTPLGVLEETEFKCQTTNLREDDILIVGTDGLWEARNPEGEMFTVERFRQFLATWQHKTAEEICTHLLARVKAFTARDNLEDDATLMIVKIPTRT